MQTTQDSLYPHITTMHQVYKKTVILNHTRFQRDLNTL